MAWEFWAWVRSFTAHGSIGGPTCMCTIQVATQTLAMCHWKVHVVSFIPYLSSLTPSSKFTLLPPLISHANPPGSLPAVLTTCTWWFTQRHAYAHPTACIWWLTILNWCRGGLSYSVQFHSHIVCSSTVMKSTVKSFPSTSTTSSWYLYSFLSLASSKFASKQTVS